MDEIERLRVLIDQADLEILRLLAARVEWAAFIGQVKNARRLSTKIPERESVVLARAAANARGLGLNLRDTQRVFGEIVDMSRNAQARTRKSSHLSDMQCLIVGGGGGMGRLFAHILHGQGAQVTIAGKTAAEAISAAREIGVEPGSLSDASRMNIVLVSVPVGNTAPLALNVSRFMKKGSLLVDLASVKHGVVDQIGRRMPKPIEYVSIHPLFGSEAGPMRGQNLLVVPYRIGRTWKRLEAAFIAHGFSLHRTNVVEHDKSMSIVQSLHHFALLSLAESFDGWDGSFQTNSLRTTLAVINSLSRNKGAVTAIQNLNPNSRQARKLFLRTVKQLSNEESFGDALDRVTTNVHKWTRKR